jgi:hypothetical protein
MAEAVRKGAEKEVFRVQFNLVGLVIFSVSLILATGALSFALSSQGTTGLQLFAREKEQSPADQPAETTPAWGELITCDVEMERPEEFTAMEVNNVGVPSWTFENASSADVRKTMLACGLTTQQADRALAPECVSTTNRSTVIHPDSELVFSLAPEARGRLYAELGRSEANHYMQFPFCFPANSFDTITAGGQLDEQVISLVKSLLYSRDGSQYVSDFDAALQRRSGENQRLSLVKALSRQSAVLARVRIRPTTDIEKLMNYWAMGSGVRFTDLRPLLSSVKQLPEGGTISLLYFLPRFARERLYTYPLPSQPGDPAMDCHWSTLNFFSETPDNRLSDPSYSVPYINSHYYRIDKPTHYGDVIFLLDEKGNAIHSAVYLADDIVFTKNGNNYRQPWMLMRLKNLLATYSANGKPRVAVYRDKNT